MKPFSHLSDEELGAALRQSLQALPDVPLALQRSAVALWPAGGLHTAVAVAVGAVLQRIAAVLSFDSWATPALASGMRSVRSPTRHLLFSAQGRDVDLRIAPAASGFALTGQVLGPDESGSVALLRQDGGEPARSAQLDALGEFRIEALSPGVYLLTLQVGGEEIALPPVEVGEPGR